MGWNRGSRAGGTAAGLCCLATALVLLLAAVAEAEVLRLEPHPLLAEVPDRGCDVVFDARSVGGERIERTVNDPAMGRIFCFAGGVDYRPDEGPEGPSANGIVISRRCTAQEPCELRARGTLRHAANQADPPLLPAIHLRDSAHWIVRGLEIRPRAGLRASRTLSRIHDSHHVIWDQTVIDGSEAQGELGAWGALVIDGSQDFHIQRNYIKDAPNPPRLDAVDAAGIVINPSTYPRQRSARGYILDNEIRNWKGVVASGNATTPACLDPNSPDFAASAMDILVEGNDMYLTDEYIFSCRDGVHAQPRSRADECTCVEAAIDSKQRPPQRHANVYRGNRIHRRRPVSPVLCSGSGMQSGAGINTGNTCEGNEIFAGNIVEDTTQCIRIAGDRAIVVDNVCADQFASSCPDQSACRGRGSPYACCTGPRRGCCRGSLGRGDGISFLAAADRWQAHRNRMLRSMGRPFEDGGTRGRAQANVVFDPGRVASNGDRRAGVTTTHNYFYGDGTTRIAYNLTNCGDGKDGDGTDGSCDDSTAVDHLFPSLGAARMQDLIYERHWWSGRERSTIRQGGSTQSSPHVQGAGKAGSASSGPFTVCDPLVVVGSLAAYDFERLESACTQSTPPADLLPPQRPMLLD